MFAASRLPTISHYAMFYKIWGPSHGWSWVHNKGSILTGAVQTFKTYLVIRGMKLYKEWCHYLQDYFTVWSFPSLNASKCSLICWLRGLSDPPQGHHNHRKLLSRHPKYPCTASVVSFKWVRLVDLSASKNVINFNQNFQLFTRDFWLLTLPVISPANYP